MRSPAKKTVPHRSEVFWSLVYVTIAIVWIITSDWLLALVVGTPYDNTAYQTMKGIAFVLVTGASLYVILRRSRLQAERQRELIQQSNQQRQVLFMNNPQPMWLYDLETLRFLEVNHAAVEQYGYSRDEFLSMTLKDIRPQDDVPRLVEDIQQERPMLQDSGEWRHQLKDGSLRDVQIISHLVQHDDRDAVLVIAYDISEQKALEARLEEQNDLRARLDRELELRRFRQRFMSMMSHQFRTPLTAVGMSANLMHGYCERGDQPHKVEEHYNRITKQVQRLNEMLDDIMEVFETEALRLEFAPVVVDCCAYLAKLAHENYPPNRVKLHTPDCPIMVEADEKLLAHAIDNLVSNALKYSPPDQSVDLKIEQHEDQVELSVCDYGVGIPQADIPRLFDAFYRGKNVQDIPGNGLGLSIVAQTVELHGGEVDVSSEVNQGTRFVVRLPRAKQLA